MEKISKICLIISFTIICFACNKDKRVLVPANAPISPKEIGDDYGGGIVTYVEADGLHGLIAAKSDQSVPVAWSNFYILTGANLSAVYTGSSNTSLIISASGTASATFAAKLCDDFISEGYNDWYLPSIDELNLIRSAYSKLSGFSSGFYWSSTEVSQIEAYSQKITTAGTKTITFKNVLCGVRAVRKF